MLKMPFFRKSSWFDSQNGSHHSLPTESSGKWQRYSGNAHGSLHFNLVPLLPGLDSRKQSQRMIVYRIRKILRRKKDSQPQGPGCFLCEMGWAARQWRSGSSIRPYAAGYRRAFSLRPFHPISPWENVTIFRMLGIRFP